MKSKNTFVSLFNIIKNSVEILILIISNINNFLFHYKDALKNSQSSFSQSNDLFKFILKVMKEKECV